MNLSETYGETSGFHATNLFINKVEPNPEWNAQVESTTAAVIANVFLDAMSDYVSNPEQSAEIASASQANSSRASPDSADPANGTEATPQRNAWPPLEVTDIDISD